MPEFSSFEIRTSEDKGTEWYDLSTSDSSVDEVWEALRTQLGQTDPDFPGIDPTAFHWMAWEGIWGTGHTTNAQQVRMQVVGDARAYGQWIDGANLTLFILGFPQFSGSTLDWLGEIFRSGVSLDGQKAIGNIDSGSDSLPKIISKTFDRAGFSIKDFIGDSDICHAELFNSGSLGLFDSVKLSRVYISGDYIQENGMFI